jgi:hypothetical protein
MVERQTTVSPSAIMWCTSKWRSGKPVRRVVTTFFRCGGKLAPSGSWWSTAPVAIAVSAWATSPWLNMRSKPSMVSALRSWVHIVCSFY